MKIFVPLKTATEMKRKAREAKEEEEGLPKSKKVCKVVFQKLLIPTQRNRNKFTREFLGGIKKNSLVRYCPQFLSSDESETLFTHLMKVCDWKHGTVKLWGGKTAKTPRLQSWMGSKKDLANKSVSLYQKGGPLEWTLLMQRIKQDIENFIFSDITYAAWPHSKSFDYVLINLYRNGKDYISWHSDGEAIKPHNCIVGSLSIGAPRRFLLRETTTNTKTEYILQPGSLITMEHATQKHFKHSVPKQLRVTAPRINLTFRFR
eukprot:TRINITY_DN848_c0_g1_i1.p1 TRINITY_DN848_c0_g1~~TRINITY_DN848_c0_g1_i1.p1  ORF type:complete len:271 (-),score=33.66 TRINITY_DN848_c0_g1_i1:729-1511(-)